MNKYLYGYDSMENAYVVENYPWGFSLRTKIRYWVETNDKKNGGQRFCSQTVNPKTGVWCAPKKGIYHGVVIMFLDENEHVKFIATHPYDTLEDLLSLEEKHKDNLTDYQLKSLRIQCNFQRVMSKVTWKIEEGPVSRII